MAISHNTTSWKSHSSTWRWTAGNDGRSPEGGKAREISGQPALACEETISQHDQGEVPMQPIPTPALVMVQPALALGVLIELFNGPAAVGQGDQPVQRRVRRQVPVIPLDLAAVTRHRALAEQPALWAGGDAVMAGRQLRAARGPVHPYGYELLAEPVVFCLAPGDGLPVVRWQRLEYRLRLIQGCWARLLGLAPPSWPRRGRSAAACTARAGVPQSCC